MFKVALIISAMVAAPTFAQDTPSGDVEKGKEAFRQCAACHVVTNDAGETLAGLNAHVGPNLYGVAMRTAGTYPEFKYGKSMIEAGGAGVKWTEENFVAYVQDPTGFLKKTLDDKRARGKMAYKVRSEDEATNLYAYLSSLAPATDAAPAAAE